MRSLENAQEEIHWQNLLNARLYSNREPLAFDWGGENTITFAPLDANLENVIANVVDTLVSRIGKNRPKATFVTRSADFSVFLKARQLDRYVWAEFLNQDIHTKGEKVFFNSLITGTGVLKIDIDSTEGEIFTESVNSDEIVVDQRQCVSACYPQELFHRRLVSRLWLKQTYGDDADVLMAIDHAQEKNFHYSASRQPSDEQVIIVEGWKLPTRPGAGDGRHTICIENATLVDEPYKRDCFPFVFFRFQEPVMGGFYGRSLVEDLTGYQIRLNELNDAIRMGQDLMCVPRVFIDQGSEVLGSKLDNVIGRQVKYRGTMPEALTWTAFNAEIYNERDRIRQSAFEFAGVSELSSQNKLPSQARLDSSEALREYNAIEDERFNRQAQAYEKFFLDVAKHLVELSAELYKNQKVNRKNVYKSRYLVEQIDWKSVDLDADKYIMQVSASSIINMSPAARKDKLNEWAAAGVISQEQYKAWSGEPDLERLHDMMSASKDYFANCIDRMLKEEDVTPDPISNVSEGIRDVTDTYLHLKSCVQTPEDILQKFRDFIELCKEILQPTAIVDPMAAAAGPPGMGMPMDPSMGGMPTDPSMMGPPGMPPQLPPGAPLNPVTNSVVPSVSPIAAEGFVS